MFSVQQVDKRTMFLKRGFTFTTIMHPLHQLNGCNTLLQFPECFWLICSSCLFLPVGEVNIYKCLLSRRAAGSFNTTCQMLIYCTFNVLFFNYKSTGLSFCSQKQFCDALLKHSCGLRQILTSRPKQAHIAGISFLV